MLYNIKELCEMKQPRQNRHNVEVEIKVLAIDNMAVLYQIQKDKIMEAGNVRTSFTMLHFQLCSRKKEKCTN